MEEKYRIKPGDVVHIKAVDGTEHLFRTVLDTPADVGDSWKVLIPGDEEIVEYFQRYNSMIRVKRGT
jgi:hypothetical protein